MSSTVVYVVIAVAVIAAVLAFAIYTNKSKARNFFVEHYGAAEAESIRALHELASAAAFASLIALSSATWRKAFSLGSVASMRFR